MSGADVSFVHLGISIPHMVKSFSIGGISFAYYGLIIGIGMILGLCVAQSDAKRRGQNPDIYLDFALYGIIFSIIGARIYYVFFQWAYYKDHLMEIVNLRKGGLAIYGGVIAGILTLLVFTKKRHLSFLSMADSACLGLITGQMIGRWGNFINCEAFGRYTDCLFAMRIRRSIVNESMISQNLLDHLILDNGVHSGPSDVPLRVPLELRSPDVHVLVPQAENVHRGNALYLSGRVWNRKSVDRRIENGFSPDTGYPDRGIPGIVCCAGDRLSCDPYLQQEKGFRPGKGSKLIWRAGKNW